MSFRRLAIFCLAFFITDIVNAQNEDTQKLVLKKQIKPKSKTSKELVALKTITVFADESKKGLLGFTGSASQGEVGHMQLEFRPLARNGELVEVIPGTLATQHSGSGKANQYFLRGFNLDHGTDLTVYVDGIPMNMPSHAHGQGYMDLNSLIPELVKKIEFGKGPYYAEVGDFSSAGYSKIVTLDTLPAGILKFTGGEFGYYRTLVAGSEKFGRGNLLYAGEFNAYNGVWQQPEDSKKLNAVIRYTLDKGNYGLSLNGKAYSNNWTATNQIPQALINNGALNLYGSMDPTDGGKTNRYSLSSQFWRNSENWKNNANLYALYYDVDLFSNFTGYLDNKVSGDQIHQFEHRIQTGGSVEYTRYSKLIGFEMDNSLGLQFRHDDILDTGLDHTVNRHYLSTVSHSAINEATAGVYFKSQVYWHDKVRTVIGLREDYINNDVIVVDTALQSAMVNQANSGNRNEVIFSPKFSLILGSWFDTEYYINAGFGYHSNDARGTTLQFDPNTGTKLDSNVARISPLAQAHGAEFGIRSQAIKDLNSTLAVWWLQSDGELVFAGDAGTTEASGKSQRYGVEWSNSYQPERVSWLILDADLALTSAHYITTPSGEVNTYIPNAVGRVITAGATMVMPSGLFGSIRLRHFGDMPLDSSGVYWAGNTSIVNLGTGYKQKRYKLEVDIFNIFDTHANDIAYSYTYAYPAGALPQTGILKHPVEPISFRATFTLNF